MVQFVVSLGYAFIWLVDILVLPPSLGPCKHARSNMVDLLNIVQYSVFKNIIPNVQMEVKLFIIYCFDSLVWFIVLSNVVFCVLFCLL